MSSDLGVRWTAGDVSDRGFEALRLSIWGAWRIFGAEARYAVCVNTLPVERARELTGSIPPGVIWHDATNDVPEFLRPQLEAGMAEGVAWKLAPARFFPEIRELSLDNDCILWELPDAIGEWLRPEGEDAFVVAEDVAACFGVFADRCGPEPRNGGIRGLPPGFDLENAMRELLEERPVAMTSELDEQGLQAAALQRAGRNLVVRVEEVTICSPFPPHLPHLGRCGAHFCGTNARRLSWEWEGRNGVEYLDEHWRRHREEVARRVGIALDPAPAGPDGR